MTGARVRWFSGRSILLHALVLVAFPLCVYAAWWQLHRALSGNTLSWFYVFEWPAFSGIAIWAWWVLVTAPARKPRPDLAVPRDPKRAAAMSREELLQKRRAPLRWDPAMESDRLRDYNRYLSELASGRTSGPYRRRRRWTS